MEPASAAFMVPVALVVPVRDEENSIEALVSSIREQTLSPAEVILVDAGSQDRTPDLAKSLIGEDRRFRLLSAGPAWPGRARNIGVSAAESDWVAFTDAGITLDRDWLRHLISCVREDPSLDVVYGNYEPRIATFFEQCAALAYVALRSRHGRAYMRGPSIASCLIRKKAFLACGGFPDLRASEDLIFMEKLESNGSRIAWQPDAGVLWTLQPTLERTFERFRLYSRHNVYAGRERHWHFGVLRQYVVFAACLFAGFLFSRWFLLIPPLALLIRALKSIWQRRDGQSVAFVCNPLRLLLVLTILVTIDAATFAGWAEALCERILGRGFFAAGRQAA